MKKMMKKMWVIALAGFILSGCGLGGFADFSAELCGGYILARNSSHDIWVVPKTGWTSPPPMIFPKVVEVGHDQCFIVVKRQELKQRNPDNPNEVLEPVPGVFDYWILDTTTPIAHGPFTLEEYTVKRTELGVPESIVLKDVYEYRK